MALGEAIAGQADDTASPLAFALDQFGVAVDHLIKIVEDGGLDATHTAGFVSFMQGFEQIRNRIPLADHRVIADADRRNLPEALTQAGMVQTLMSTLRLSPGEASRRVRPPPRSASGPACSGNP